MKLKVRDLWCPCKLVHWEGERYESVVNNSEEREREEYHIHVYLSFVQHNSSDIICSMETCCCCFDANISFEDMRLLG